MASTNKKKKARNSFLYNGNEKQRVKLKGVGYFVKADRLDAKKEIRNYKNS